LRLDRSVSSREGEASDLFNIGQVYFSLGNKSKALAFLQLALKASSLLARPREVAIVLLYMGSVYESLGKEKEALEHYSRALNLIQGSGFKRDEAITLNDIVMSIGSWATSKKP
jgi:tetratricopeptide (TPR) repeat protein